MKAAHVLMGVVFMAISSCAESMVVPTPTEQTDADAIRDPAPGTRTESRVEETFDLVLTSNPTTGYYWIVLGNDGGIVELKSETYIADPAPEGLVGSGGKQVFVFEAVAPGEADLVLSYQRSEDDVADTLNLRVEVTE
ncbi:MAG: protease inhibitor I42 family protein [Pseudomonadota bacterium]